MSAPVTVITGGGTGVGAALARILTDRGHKVVIAGRRKEPLEAVGADTGATVVVGDVSNEKGAKALIDEFTQGDPSLFRAAGAMNSELMQDPDAARQMKTTQQHWVFLGAVMKELQARGG
jgi:NADP-dependent 3-hydroxy acid dehydrogenase YdfG